MRRGLCSWVPTVTGTLVGDLELVGGRSCDVSLAVLPHDVFGVGVDDDDAVAIVVVDAEQAGGELFDEAGVVEHLVSAVESVGVGDLAFAGELVDAAGFG